MSFLFLCFGKGNSLFSKYFPNNILNCKERKREREREREREGKKVRLKESECF